MRTVASPYLAVVDNGLYGEDPARPGFWKSGISPDGLHFNTAGYTGLMNSGTLNPATLAALTASLKIWGTVPQPVINVPFNYTQYVGYGSGAKDFALTGTLPTGLSFNHTTGAITGTATAAETKHGLNITVTDSSGSASLGSFSLSVASVGTNLIASPRQIDGWTSSTAVITADAATGPCKRRHHRRSHY